MLNHSSTSESISNLLTGTVIVASAMLFYAALVIPQASQPQAPATAAQAPVVEQVVVTAPHHVG